MRKTTKSQDIIVNVTEKGYQADLARGLQADEVLQPGRHTFKRGAFLTRHRLKPGQTAATAKVRISINLDYDVLTHFKRRAAQPNAAPYQTQINNALRTVMEGDQAPLLATQRSQVETLLADQHFIDAVARRVREHTVTPQKRSRRAA
jgi:uncharacterized protein (DUF4415 family)